MSAISYEEKNIRVLAEKAIGGWLVIHKNMKKHKELLARLEEKNKKYQDKDIEKLIKLLKKSLT